MTENDTSWERLQNISCPQHLTEVLPGKHGEQRYNRPRQDASSRQRHYLHSKEIYYLTVALTIVCNNHCAMRPCLHCNSSSDSIGRIIGPPSLAMPHQLPHFDKLLDMFFHRITVRLKCRRNELYADAAVVLSQFYDFFRKRR